MKKAVGLQAGCIHFRHRVWLVNHHLSFITYHSPRMHTSRLYYVLRDKACPLVDKWGENPKFPDSI
jgi:hypothetical protein